MINAIHHIAFACQDVASQEAFYTEKLGFRRVRVYSPAEGPDIINLRLGSCILELFASTKAEPDQRGGEQAVGFKHLAFEVEDLESTVKGLQDAGIHMGPIRRLNQLLEGLRVCFFADPEGNILELVEGFYDET